MLGAAHYQARVEVIEFLGNELLAHLRLHDDDVLAMLPSDVKLQEGASETFSVPLAKILLFDSSTEQAVGTAAP
jgi:ABC-type sugar transport system ATPase subunit